MLSSPENRLAHQASVSSVITAIEESRTRVSSAYPYIRMAGGGNFVHRVLSYVANELIVNGLSNSPRFQRFAVRTSKKMEEITDIAAQKKKELAEQMKDVSKNFDSFKNQ